ncbi:MAG: class I SAM-dependent methyltransferase [Candidatus Limnocylindrales bacterium]
MPSVPFPSTAAMGPDDPALKPSLRAVWDAQAAGYDTSPGHGVIGQSVERTWFRHVMHLLGDARTGQVPPRHVLDVGTGTGAMALFAARLGHRVTAIDLAPAMLAQGVERARHFGLAIDFAAGDAEVPQFASASFDVVMSRHVLWTLPHPAAAATRWADLVVPGGLVAVFDIYHPRLPLPRRVVGVLAERIDRAGRRQSGGHHYSAQQRAALPLAVQRDPSAGDRVLHEAGLVDVTVVRLRDIDAAEWDLLRPLQRFGRPWRRYLATGRRAAG